MAVRWLQGQMLKWARYPIIPIIPIIRIIRSIRSIPSFRRIGIIRIIVFIGGFSVPIRIFHILVRREFFNQSLVVSLYSLYSPCFSCSSCFLIFLQFSYFGWGRVFPYVLLCFYILIPFSYIGSYLLYQVQVLFIQKCLCIL